MATFYHATSKDSLHKILESNQLKSLRHISMDDPNLELSVEPNRWNTDRATLKAADAVRVLEVANKNPDKVFLSRDKVNTEYGNYVIAKELKHPKFHGDINFRANEFVTRRRLSPRHKAKIYVPAEELEELKQRYPKFKFIQNAELKDKHATMSDKAKTLLKKVLYNVGIKKQASATNLVESLGHMSESALRAAISTKAMIGGSEGLGISISSNSDRDIIITYKREADFKRGIARIKSIFPTMVESKYNANRPNKKVYTILSKGKPVDVVLAWGAQPEAYRDSFVSAKNRLTDVSKLRIVKNKEDLKNSWFFPETRYKNYKKQLDTKLGIKRY